MSIDADCYNRTEGCLLLMNELAFPVAAGSTKTDEKRRRQRRRLLLLHNLLLLHYFIIIRCVQYCCNEKTKAATVLC